MTITPAYGPLFGARAAAQYLGMTVSRVRQLIRRGELVALRRTNGRLEGIYQADCDAYVASHRQTAQPPAAPRPAVDDHLAQLPEARHFQ